MSELKSYSKLLDLYGKENLFEFKNEDHIYVLVGYPHWRSFIINPKSNLSLEVFPRINLSTRKFEFLEEDNQKNSAEKFILKVEDPKTLMKYLEWESNFFDTIPVEIFDRVNLFIDSHWEIIKAIVDFGHNFITLIDSNPLLAYLLVNLEKLNASFSIYIDKCYIETVMVEKQKEILRLANFPSTKRMVKIFSKFDPKLVDVESLKSFQSQLMCRADKQEKIFKILSHSRMVNKNLLHIIAFAPSVLDILSSRATQELIKSDSFLSLSDVIKPMSLKANKWKIPVKVDRLENLNKAEENLNAAIKKRKDEINNFPSQPAPDGEGIYALKTVSEQNSWARRQQNCIRGYVRTVMARRCYIYKVIFSGEEATLEIKIQKDGLKLGQLKGFKNQRASKELWVHVRKWFDDFIKQQMKTEKKKYKMLELEL